MIVNDPDHDQKIANHENILDEHAVDVDPSLYKGKEKENRWFEEDEGENSVLKTNVDQQFDEHFDEHMGGADEYRRGIAAYTHNTEQEFKLGEKKTQVLMQMV